MNIFTFSSKLLTVKTSEQVFIIKSAHTLQSQRIYIQSTQCFVETIDHRKHYSYSHIYTQYILFANKINHR